VQQKLLTVTALKILHCSHEQMMNKPDFIIFRTEVMIIVIITVKQFLICRLHDVGIANVDEENNRKKPIQYKLGKSEFLILFCNLDMELLSRLQAIQLVLLLVPARHFWT